MAKAAAIYHEERTPGAYERAAYDQLKAQGYRVGYRWARAWRGEVERVDVVLAPGEILEAHVAAGAEPFRSDDGGREVVRRGRWWHVFDGTGERLNDKAFGTEAEARAFAEGEQVANYMTSAIAHDYFDHKITERQDFQRTMKQAERDVLAYYRRAQLDTRHTVFSDAVPSGLGTENLTGQTGRSAVHLRYYETDADNVSTTDADEVLFKQAMRDEIASVIEHRLQKQDRSFPTGFGRFLKPFDLRPRPNII